MAGELGLAQRGKLHEQPMQRPAVGRKVVAGQDCERFCTGRPPARQRFDQETMRCLWPRRVGEVGDDAGMVLIEPARRAAQIGFFRNRQRDDADVGIGQRVEQSRWIARRDEDRSDRAYDTQLLAVTAALGERVETVRRLQRIMGRGALQRGADDAPVRFAGGEAAVDIGRLVRAVEGANAEMHDAGRYRGAVIGWCRHRRRQPLQRLV